MWNTANQITQSLWELLEVNYPLFYIERAAELNKQLCTVGCCGSHDYLLCLDKLYPLKKSLRHDVLTQPPQTLQRSAWPFYFCPPVSAIRGYIYSNRGEEEGVRDGWSKTCGHLAAWLRRLVHVCSCLAPTEKSDWVSRKEGHHFK